MKTAVRVLSIDPGLQNTGFAVVEKTLNNQLRLIDLGSVHTLPNTNMSERLAYIFNFLVNVVKTYQPNALAIEDIFINNNNQSSLKLAYARSTVLLIAGLCELPYEEFNSKTIKKAITGYGAANKTQIANALTFFFPELKKNNWKQDTTDAIAIGLCYLQHHRYDGARV